MLSQKNLSDELLNHNSKLLGQIIITDDDYFDLVNYAKWRLSESRSIISVDLKLSVLAVQVAIREYREGRYWPCFSNVLGCDISTASQHFIGQTFLKTIKHYNLLSLDRGEGASQMFVENIKAHAFVTNWYLDGFFDFSYAYFENNLFRQIPEDIEEDFSDLSKFMQSTLVENSDTIIEQGSKAARSYKLLKSTRAVIAQSDPDLLKVLFFPTLKSIEKYFYDGVTLQANDRVAASLKNWCEKQEGVQGKETRRVAEERRLYSQKPYIKYIPLDNLSYIVIPKQKFRNEECNGTASIEILIDNEIIKKELELYKSFGIYISEEIRVRIPNPFNALHIEIKTEVIKKYNINGSNYRIFNDSWELSSKFIVGHNHLIVKNNEKVVFEDTTIIDDSLVGLEWQHYYVNFTNDSVCFIDSLMVSTIGEFSYDPVFEEEINDFQIVSHDGVEYKVSRSNPVISFLVGRDKVKGTVLEINGIRRTLDNLQDVSIVSWPQDRNLCAVTIRLEEEHSLISDGHYKVLANIPGESIKEIADYFLIRMIKCKVPNNIYVFADFGSVTVCDDEFHYLNIPKEWEQKELCDGSIKYFFPFNEYIDFIDIALNEESGVYYLRLPVRMFAYGFSKEVLEIKASKYIWYNDLRESLYLKLPNANNVSVGLKVDKRISVDSEDLGNGLFRADITRIVSEIKNDMRHKSFIVDVDFDTDRHRWLSLPVVLRKTKVCPYFTLSEDENGVYTDINIQGEADISITVLEHYSKNVVLSDVKVQSGRNYLKGLCENDFYDICPKMTESDDFFNTKEEPLKYIRGTGVVNKNNLTNCRLPIGTLVYDEEELYFNKQKLFIDLYKQNNRNEYEGVLKQQIALHDKKPQTKYVCKVMVTVYENIDNTMTVTFVMYSELDDAWAAPFYHIDRHQFVSCDSKLVLSSKEYDKFLLLDEDEAEYSIIVKKIRRFR